MKNKRAVIFSVVLAVVTLVGVANPEAVATAATHVACAVVRCD
jgi:hypothetical protein